MKLSIQIKEESDGRWLAEVLEFPGVAASGATLDEARSRAQALALRVLAEQLETGALTRMDEPIYVSTHRSDELVPQRLYKYRGALPADGTPELAWRRSLIVDSQLFFARPSALNDPFDCVTPRWVLDAGGADLAEFGHQLRQRYVDKHGSDPPPGWAEELPSRLRSPQVWNEAWSSKLDDYGVFSMSAAPDHELMWAHYGQEHRGYCVEFSELAGCLDPASSSALAPRRVTYAGDRFEVRASEFMRARLKKNPAWQGMIEALLRKSEAWRYEREWRLIGKRGDCASIPHEVLTAVILGARCLPRDEQLLREWAAQRRHPVAFKRVVLGTTDYSLRIE